MRTLFVKLMACAVLVLAAAMGPMAQNASAVTASGGGTYCKPLSGGYDGRLCAGINQGMSRAIWPKATVDRPRVLVSSKAVVYIQICKPGTTSGFLTCTPAVAYNWKHSYDVTAALKACRNYFIGDPQPRGCMQQGLNYWITPGQKVKSVVTLYVNGTRVGAAESPWQVVGS